MEQSESLRLIYQIPVDDIKYAKDRQWKIIYYVLLTFAAIIGLYLSKFDKFFLCWTQKLILLLPALFVSYVGIFHLMDSHKRQCEYRMRLFTIKNKIYKACNDILDIGVEIDKCFAVMQSVFFAFLMFIIVIVLYKPGLKLVCLIAFLVFIAIDYFIYRSKGKRINIDQEYRYLHFSRYFWTLIFPFIILIIMGLISLVWLLSENQYSLIEIIEYVIAAELSCFLPVYWYQTHIVNKAITKLKEPTVNILISLVKKTISFIKRNKDLSKEQRDSIIRDCENLLSHCCYEINK